jgi:hypothetical protein
MEEYLGKNLPFFPELVGKRLLHKRRYIFATLHGVTFEKEAVLM